MYHFLNKWPDVSRVPQDIEKLFGHKLIGLDLEWGSDGKPTILGLSDGTINVSCHWKEGLPYLLQMLREYPDTTLVGHNIVGADIFVLEQQGIKIDLAHVEDSIIRHWLCNLNLCKSTGKAALEEDEGEKRGRGFMNLWTMASLYTDLPHWKDCRDSQCDGICCPEHDVFGYNGVDALAPVLALPQLRRTSMLRGLEKLYPLHRQLAYVLAKMRDYGVYTDVPYINTLRSEFEHDKAAVAAELPFNPQSEKQVREFFKEKHDLTLENNQEQTIRDLVDELGEDDAPDELILLRDYKELGNGPDRWFKAYYRDKNGHLKGFLDEFGFVHPHLGFFTSSARLMCSSPNLQNVAKRRVSRKKCVCGHLKTQHINGENCIGTTDCRCERFSGESIGKKIRRAFIAPPGYYLARADYSNAENRNYLYLAGYEPPEGDLHAWMVANIGLKETDPFAIAMGSARDASKSVTHACDYLEGLKLRTRAELRKPKLKKEISEGALLVFPEWTFKEKIVTFTGINLARRAFGEATIENRKRALEISGRYIDKTFPKLRDLQKQITKQVETEGVVRPPHGYVLLSYGPDEDRLKTAAAVWGSQPVAHMSKVALVKIWERFERDGQQRPILQVHDEILTYVKDDIPPDVAMDALVNDMEIETPEMPGFRIPAEPSFGPNWKEQTKRKKA